MQTELIYNPRGGQVVVRHEIEAVTSFLTSHGWHVTCRETREPGEATGLARDAVRRGAGVVVAVGGDGTVSEVANGLIHTDAVLGVLPAGTTNSWALQMGIPALNPLSPGTGVARLVADLGKRLAHPLHASYYRTVLLDAARVLVEGRTVAVDVGEVAGRHFMMWAGIGLDASILESVPPKEKKALGSWAYVLTAIGSIGQSSCTDVRLTLDGKVVNVSTPSIIVNNIQLYGGMLPIGARAKVNDGKLDVCVFKGDGFITFVQHALKVLSHKHLQDPKMDYYQCREVTIESAQPLPVHLDAEPFTGTPVTIRTLPLALKVIVPEKTPGNLFTG